MTDIPVEPIQLFEYSPKLIPKEQIPDDVGEILWKNYGRQVNVEFPSPKTNRKWQITSKGWAGYIPLTPDFAFHLHPKVDIQNLFGMLEYAYNLESFRFIEGLMDCRSLKEFYESLARILALRVLDRGRKGYYHAYQLQKGPLPYVRGKLDIRQNITKPWDINLECHYEEYTSDIEDNQILAWTLNHILRSGICTEKSLPVVRQAHRNLRGFTSSIPFYPRDCVGRLYNRLNLDYQSMHAICKFFLEHNGPSHQVGDKTILPFLVNMARLYEKFVAEWLKLHLPSEYSIQSQERIAFGQGQKVHFDIDLVLYENANKTARCVMDTKYKVPTRPSSEDLKQILAYAKIKRCNEAILIYPESLDEPLNEFIEDTWVRSLNFSLDGDLDMAGEKFIQELFDSMGSPADPNLRQ